MTARRREPLTLRDFFTGAAMAISWTASVAMFGMYGWFWYFNAAALVLYVAWQAAGIRVDNMIRKEEEK